MIDGIPFIEWTPSGILGFLIILILVGRLTPKRVLDDMIKDRDSWRTAYEVEREARITSDKQTAELLEVTRTTQELIRALFNNSERIAKTGEIDVASKE